ncbi:MAG: hypothetical protein M0002_13700 [Rhodospirillales bacterium]|nr:hypothetical protein [Rhodospirillales bacterium]
MNEAQQQEVDRNYDAFRKLLPTILPKYQGKYALMKDGKVLGYFSSAEDARVSAVAFIKDGLFSIQQVTDIGIDLGFFTHAVPVG